MEATVVVAVVGVGLIFGSFTNVLIARIPAGESWVRGSSRCPACRHAIAWHDNIPIVSWLWLRRRCRHCRAPISGRYPLVESLVAILFLAVYLVHGLDAASVALGYLAVVSVALFFIDIDVQRLPDSIVLPSYLVVAGLLALDAGLDDDWRALGRAGLGALVLGGAYALLWLGYRRGLGGGDFTTAGLLGLAAGYLGWKVVAVAGIAGPIIGGAIVAAGLLSGRLRMKSRIPYGPALISGAWLAYLAGPIIADAYLSLVGVGG